MRQAAGSLEQVVFGGKMVPTGAVVFIIGLSAACGSCARTRIFVTARAANTPFCAPRFSVQ